MEKKLKTREFALTRIAAKTWGPGLIRAREVYTKCIRSAIAYGASSYHEPTESKGRPEGVAKELGKAQNRSLRVVAGAYRAAPIRALETEAWVPPPRYLPHQETGRFREANQGAQVRTGAIGLRAFLFKARAPEAPTCRFSSGPERETVFPVDIKLDRWTGTP